MAPELEGTFERRLARTGVVLAAAVATLATWAILAAVSRSDVVLHGADIFRLQLAFTPEAFGRVLEQWGPTGVQQFRTSLAVDYLYAIAYAVFLASLLARLATRPPQRPSTVERVFVRLPLVAGACDCVENSLHLLILSDADHLSPGLIFTASSFAAVKWALVIVSISIIVCRTAVAIIRSLARPMSGG